MSSYANYLKTFSEDLNKISPSFCTAKWLQVTLHLHTGHNHSCHHPVPHLTPLEELKGNPSALHNTLFKKEQRQKMKNGIRPKECDYCWNVEDLGKGLVSDRTLKSADPIWGAPFLDKIKNLPADVDVNPSYVEVSFSNVCNFRCSYCSANFSTRWSEDIKRNGSYSTHSGEQSMEIVPEENNPYVKAFWEWWPNLVDDLKVFRITGGEPLLSKNTFRVLEDLSQNPRPNLEICINSNLGTSDASYQRFLALAKDLTENKKVKMLRLYTSVDAWGEKAEYIRDGLEFLRFQKNLEEFLNEVPLAKSSIMVTFNSLSVTSFKPLLRYVRALKTKDIHKKGDNLFIDTAYLRGPSYQTVQVLPESYQAMVADSLEYMKAEMLAPNNPEGFKYQEIAKLERVLEWMKVGLPKAELRQRRQEFYRFFSEHDKRRNTSFLNSFPEMEEFWSVCRDLV